MDPVKALTQPLERLGQAAQNALEVARFGGLETGEEAMPYDVVGGDSVHRLRRYFPDSPQGAPVLLVPPMMLAAEVYDVAPTASAVAILHEHGADPWVVDFGAPEHEEGGLERTLADHVIAVSRAVDRVRDVTGHDVHLGGYSQGGMFCYQTAALRRSKGIASLVVFGSPVDTRGALPFGLPEEVATRAATVLADTLLARRALPAWASRLGFRMLDPVKAVRQQIDFLLQLHDREALLPRERQRRFLQAEGWVAWPGPALADFMHQFVEHNRMLQGGFVIEDRLVTLADIDCPVLTFVGSVDEIAPPASVRAITQAAPRADVYECELRAGHFGLVVGSQAKQTTWPVVAGWTRWRDEDGPLPDNVVPAEARADANGKPGAPTRLAHGLGLATQVGLGAARSLVGTGSRTARSVRLLTEEAAAQIPRLTRLETVRPRTRISLGLLLEEQARRAPGDICFLWEGRAHTNSAAKDRIDAVVRGFISVGVRQGEHVGVLMGPRPSSLVAVAALSRLGAVAVLLRPDASVAREAELGEVARIVADPENAAAAAESGLPAFVLGGGGGPRELGLPVVDMERIDPDAVPLPGWFEPNPGRARDLAFILFSGEGENTSVNRITNRRWVLSALGTASSAALTPADTVYSVTPVYHPSGLMVSLGGAIAAGSRIALATHFDPDTFWEEVRRYGVTVTSYTWTMLRDLVNAPPNPGERHHPVRLFMGSGMPRGLWRRVAERFAPARVVEFYASTQGEAVLVNVRGQKIGAMGRPLPGSAPVRIAAYDLVEGRLEQDSRGFVREAGRGETGLLLSEVDPDSGGFQAENALRGVFRRDDAWLPTGDLFRQDEDGDYWLMDSASGLIRTADGIVSPGRVRAALESLDAVDLAVCYGVRTEKAGHEVAVAAIMLCRDAELRPADVAGALGRFVPDARPAVVHVVDEIPVTTWYRPITGPLRKAGLPEPGEGVQAWARDAKGNYRALTPTARKRLAAGR